LFSYRPYRYEFGEVLAAPDPTIHPGEAPRADTTDPGGSMSFRRTRNAHDVWMSYVDDSRELLAVAGLPPAALASERTFRQLLTRGQVEIPGRVVRLAELTEPQFEAVVCFVRGVVPFDMDELLFEAFLARLQRRA
jgi:hypothetical protein